MIPTRFPSDVELACQARRSPRRPKAPAKPQVTRAGARWIARQDGPDRPKKIMDPKSNAAPLRDATRHPRILGTKTMREITLK